MKATMKNLNVEIAHELDNANVGDGVTYNMYSDREAGTIIEIEKSRERTAKVITMQFDTVTLLNGANSDAPDRLRCYPGGFAGHVEGRQRYSYERNPNGATIKFSRRVITNKSTGEIVRIEYKRVGVPVRETGSTLSVGRHQHYDYNF